MYSGPAHPIRRLAIAASLALLPPAAESDAAGGYRDYVDWKGWARVDQRERAGLASSWDRAGGNIDANHYEFPPGLILGDLDVTAATLRGPGIVYRFWMPHRTATQPFAVRMYFDGEATPRIDSDSREILGGAFSYFGPPFVTTFAGGQVCYESIAFGDSLRIDTENRDGLLHYYQYSYRVFAAGTDIVSWDGTLDAREQADRSAAISMFQSAGQHPAGESISAVRTVVGPMSVPPGETLTIASLVGPGWIRRLNLRMDGATDEELDGLRLRVFWDEDSLPSIDAPLGWFFGAGDDRAPYRSLPIGTSSPDGFYCYWPMPFHGAARVELLNTMSVPIGMDSTVVEHDPGPVGTDMGYLHAVARAAIRSPGMTRYVLAELSGTGHYVGNFLFVEQDYDSHWMLEGDDIVIVDDVDILNGTGLEDAYNGGYYYNWNANPMDEPEGPSPPFAIRPLCGILRVVKTASPPFARADQYRWMIGDRVPFARSLEVAVESDYAQVGSRWKSVAFWYQLPIPAAGAPSPGGGNGRPLQIELTSIVPNPATGAVTVWFAVPARGPVSLDLIDLTGRKVATMSDGPLSAGAHAIRWSRGDLPSGVYIVRLRACGHTQFQKLVLLQ